MNSEYSELFETITKESNVSPTTIATFLTETLKALKREGAEAEKISENQMIEIFKALDQGELTKEALPEIAKWLSKHEGKSLDEAIASLGLKMLTKEELEKIVDIAFKANKKLVEERGAEAFTVIMSYVMREVRGKANATLVAELIKRKLT
jgi:glutamyl-tRNA(Gln) amidotransferase subunit E